MNVVKICTYTKGDQSLTHAAYLSVGMMVFARYFVSWDFTNRVEREKDVGINKFTVLVFELKELVYIIVCI
jgi:hypothetical protein